MSNLASSQTTENVGSADTITTSRILLVDDSQVMLSVIRKYLELHDFRNIKTAMNGRDGLDVANSWKPDIILTDIQMPVMDGYELCRQIRSGTDTADIPILFMTGLTKPEDRNAAFSAGASDLITKPVDHLELVGRLKVHLDRRRLIKRLSEYHTRMAQELKLAREMQEAILPSSDEIGKIRQNYPVEFGSYYQASIGLGGDLWSVHALDPTRLLVCLVDFSGHGVGAALNTFRFQAFLSSTAMMVGSPGRLLEAANRFLHSHLPLGQFATMFCGVIDFDLGRLTYASASAPPVILGNNYSDVEFQLLETAGLPLGLVESGQYKDVNVDFAQGAMMLMYSDALIETPEPPDAVFAPEGLRDLIAAAGKEMPVDSLVQKIVAHLLSHAKGLPDDDLTLVCVSHRPK